MSRWTDYGPLSPEGYATLQQLAVKIDRENKERARMTTPRDRWTPQQHLDDALARLSPLHKRLLKARETLRDDLAALDTPKSRRILTEAGREEERQKALRKAHEGLDEYRQALALAEGMLERREAFTGPARVFREARFVPIDPDNPLMSEMVEEMKRARIWNELMTAPPAELAETIREASATHNRALMHLAGQIYQRRVVQGSEQGFTAAGAALQEAQRMELPKDVQQLEERFAELATIKADLDDVIPELRTGQQGSDVRTKAKRAKELGDELGPEAGPAAYVEEQQAARAARVERAQKRADQVITDAVLADESDAAAAFTIPITHNPNPSAD